VKKLKYVVVGLVIGVMLALSIGVFAEGFTVLLNPFPIFINGQETEVEAYNINGFTFLKLADVGKCFGATTKFNETDQRIEVSNSSSEASKSSAKVTIPNLMTDKTLKKIVDISTQEVVSAELLYFDIDLKEVPSDKYVETRNCKAVKYNDNIYMYSSDIFSKLNIHFKSLTYLERDKAKFYTDDNEAVFNTKDPNIYIHVDGDSYYNINLFKELIGE
jgi:hypothetical protein